MAKRHVVCRVAELPPGERRIIKLNGVEVGVFNVDGNLYAIRNLCPHHGAPLCLGTIGGTMLPSRPQEFVYGRHNEILRCPWHGWEFDLRTGETPFIKKRVRAKTYRIDVEAGDVVIYL